MVSKLEVGDTEVFVANVVDLNDSLESLTIEWLYGGQPVCLNAYIDRNDDTFCELELLPEVTSIQVVVRDSANSVGEDILNFTLAQNSSRSSIDSTFPIRTNNHR